jgi:gliding motility-associated-like protein
MRISRGASSFFIIYMLVVHFHVMGQNRCGSLEYNHSLINQKVVLESDEQFEIWLEQMKNSSTSRQQGRKSSSPYVIRTVVHIIHNGEQMGIGPNISDEQVQSQIEVLNKDYNRLNEDQIQTPPEYVAVAGSMDITFELAGITRHLGSKGTWTIDDNVEVKSNGYWPAEDYLNIWICDLSGHLGFTQFPVSTLPGIEDSPNNRLTDGLVISYKVFGSIDYGSFSLLPAYSKGRTTVHEIGHFFGLRHIWGDVVGCGGTDYVTDTPSQSDRSFGCPIHPQPDCTVGGAVSNRMFQNYMDFTNDNCMNLFTQRQTERMSIVLENSPRRASLLLPLEKPPIAGIAKIFSPNGDGINDYWRWTNPTIYNECTLLVFNRFGKKVFEMKDYDNSWDGRSSEGYLLEPEAYYYVIKCPNKNEVTGGVRIVR